METTHPDSLFKNRQRLWDKAVSAAAVQIFLGNFTGKSILPFMRTTWEETCHQMLKLSPSYCCDDDCFLNMSSERRQLLIVQPWRMPAFQKAIYLQFK